MYDGVTVNGCNIRGLVNLFLCIGTFFVGIWVSEHIFHALGLVVGGLGIVGGVWSDLRYRWKSESDYSKGRFFYPSCGGAILFIPVWAIYIVFVVTLIAVALVR